MATNYIGQAVKRREDYRFITGAGQYTDDVTLPGQTSAYFIRSPHAHAKIKSIRKDKALKSPGVVAIFTGDDTKAINGLPCGWLITDVNNQPMKEPPHPVLAQGKVRHVGDQVAVVIAETLKQAKDAAELVEIDYEVLPAVVDVADARKPGAPALHDIAPDNTCYVWGLGDKAAVDKAFAGAAHVTTLEFVNNRLIPNAIEPRAANASYSRADDSYTLYVASQNPHVERLLMTAFVLGLPEHKVRVIAPDVGGGFGSKIYLYAEDVVVTWASKQINRPVKWTAERSESFMSDAHGRDHVTKAELAHGQERQVPRHARAHDGEHGRVPLHVRVVHPDDPVRDAARRPVHDAGHLLRSDRGVHQHGAGGRVPRRRPARRRPTSSSGWSRPRRAR